MTPREAALGASGEGEFEASVLAKRAIADGVMKLTLSPLDGRAFPAWEPGTHVDLVSSDELIRQYSLCGDPEQTREWRLAVQRETAGKGRVRVRP